MMAGKVALITGAAAGIGASCAKRLAQDGIAIGVLDIDAQRCTGTVEAITAAGGKAMALGADVSKKDQVEAAVAELRSAFGPITIVVNSAGVTDFTPFEETAEERWRRVYEINVWGTIVCIQAVLPDMKAAKWGRVVNLSSSSAQTGAVGMAIYSSSKGAIVSLTRTLAQELGPHGITVNNIPPGSVMNTIMSEASRDRFPIPYDTLIQMIPVRRQGEPEDIAHACAFLVDDAASYFTGQTVGVNGGRVVS